MRGPRAVQSFGCTSRWNMRWSAARFVHAKDLRRPSSCDQRCTQRQLEGQSDAIKRTGGGRAPAIALTGGSGTDRRNQIHSGLMTCLQPGDETDGLDSDIVIDVLDHQEQP